MNKKEFVEQLAKKIDISQAKTGKIVNDIFDGKEGLIASTLANGDSITIPGFGTFAKKHRAQRQGINPSTKEPITIAAKDYPAFKAGKTLKDSMN